MATTLKDVAQKANVSIATVSRVLNNKAEHIGISDQTKAVVLAAARELGFQPNRFARNLRMGRHLKHILFLSYNPDDSKSLIGHPFFSGMLHGMQTEATKSNYFISYFNATLYNQDSLFELLDGEVNAIISWGYIPEAIEAAIYDKRLPFVSIEPYTEREFGHPSIYVNNRLAISQVLEHLYALGHRRIGLVSERNGTLPQFAERRKAFSHWITEHGLEVFPSQEVLSVPTLDSLCDQATDCSVFNVWLDASKGRIPTAIVATHDQAALATLRILRNAGVMSPKDVSVVGIDDIAWSKYNDPPLTTVRIPKEDIGRTAIQLVNKLLQRRKLDTMTVFIDTELVIRSTTRLLE